MGAAGVSMYSKSSDTSDTDRDIALAWQLVAATRRTFSIEIRNRFLSNAGCSLAINVISWHERSGFEFVT